LEYVERQTPEICLAAVQQTGQALRYVKQQTLEICLAAVQQDGWALEYVKQQTPELCLAAVQQCGWALQYVKQQTPELCLAAAAPSLLEACEACVEEESVVEIDEDLVSLCLTRNEFDKLKAAVALAAYPYKKGSSHV
jgi:hypothetical protein